MLAIDTNVSVRFLVNDDPAQAVAARDLILGEIVFVTATVLLETEWVLRSTYRLTKGQVIDRLGAFIGLPNVRLESGRGVVRALAWAAEGMDLADALHLAAADGCEAFVTFDRRLVRQAQEVGAPARSP